MMNFLKSGSYPCWQIKIGTGNKLASVRIGKGIATNDKIKKSRIKVKS
jgi:hypothetical protein